MGNDRYLRRALQSLLSMAICALLLSCSVAHREKTTEENTGAEREIITSNRRPMFEGQRIAPNKCRILGTVVAIDSTLELTDPSDPCSKVPCRATVRIDSVLGYGQAFPEPLTKGEEVSVKFKFTLSPTESLFPNMTQSYPGVQLGSTILSDIEAHERPMQIEASALSFEIYGYELQ